MILRLPPDVADEVNDRLQQGTAMDDLSLTFTDTQHELGLGPESAACGRVAQFKINGHKFKARMQELPCVVEAQKTRDNSMYIKVGDISQMVVVYDQATDLPDLADPESFFPSDGLTQPLANVKARFRKCELTDEDTSVMHAVEKEIQR